MKQKLIKYGAVASTFAATATTAFAQGANSTIITLTQPEGIGVASIGDMISAVFNAAIVFAILFVFGMLLIGGYGWITAGGDKTKVEEARTRITNAIIGLAIVASAWALITVIATFFGVNFSEFNVGSAAGGNTGQSGTPGGSGGG